MGFTIDLFAHLAEYDRHTGSCLSAYRDTRSHLNCRYIAWYHLQEYRFYVRNRPANFAGKWISVEKQLPGKFQIVCLNTYAEVLDYAKFLYNHPSGKGVGLRHYHDIHILRLLDCWPNCPESLYNRVWDSISRELGG